MKTKNVLSKKMFWKLNLMLILIVIGSYSALAEDEDSSITFVLSKADKEICEDCIPFFIPRSELLYLFKESELLHNKTNTMNNSSCAYEFKINTERVHNDTLRFSYDILPENPSSFEIKYWVEDYFGNVVRNSFITSNTNWKQFTPNFLDKYQVFLIKSELIILECNATYNAEKWVIVSNLDFEEEDAEEKEEADFENSFVEVEHVYLANTLRFGRFVDVRIRFVNFGNRDSLYLYVVDEYNQTISQVIHFDVFRNSDAVITQSIFVEDFCIENKSASVVIEGFGDSDRKNIFLNCPNPVKIETTEVIDEKVDLSTELKSEVQGSYESVASNFRIDNLLHNIPNFPDIIYSSRGQRTKSVFPTIFMFSLISALAVFIKYKF